MSELGKTISKKNQKKNQCQNVASEQKATSEEGKFQTKTRPRMNYKRIKKII